MIHVTNRALAYLYGQNYDDIEVGVQACDGAYGWVDDLVGVEALQLGSTSLPNCPQCAVLLDSARMVSTLQTL